MHAQDRGASRFYEANKDAIVPVPAKTGRKEGKQALGEDGERFKVLAEATFEGLLLTEGGVVLGTNEAMLAMLGYEEREVIDRSVLDFIAPEHRDQVWHNILREYKEPYEIVGVKKDGTHLELEVRGKTVRYLGRAVRVTAVRDVTERKKAERKIRRLNEELERRVEERTVRLAASEHRLKGLIGRLVATQEEERRMLAYEVHDGLTQVAVAAHQHLEHFASRHPPGSTVEEGEIDRALAHVRQAVGEARRVIEGLRPAALDDFGLAKAVEMRIADLEAEGWKVDFQDTLGEERPSREVEAALYRVVQEALTNVRKHARTNKARVTLSRRGASIRVEVRDEGCGFVESAAAAGNCVGEKVGLVGMRERVGLLGGKFEVRSTVGVGTSVMATVPLANSEEDMEAIHAV